MGSIAWCLLVDLYLGSTTIIDGTIQCPQYKTVAGIDCTKHNLSKSKAKRIWYIHSESVHGGLFEVASTVTIDASKVEGNIMPEKASIKWFAK